jgi:hypothetical protein
MSPKKTEMIGNQKYQNRFIYLNQLSAFFKSSFSSLGLIVLLSMTGTSLVFAQSWQKLNEDQRSVLAPLQEDWSSLSQGRQKKWVEVANRYPQMSEAERIALQSRMAEWAGLSTKERQSARDNYLRTLKFSPEKKAAAWESYQQLSEEDKKRLAEKKASSTKPTTVTSPTLK